MRKRIVITALTAMVAASTILPASTAYAARPAGAPDVSTEDWYKAKHNYGVNLNKYYYAWCDQYVDALNSIPNARDRYRRIIELVSANWESVTEAIYGHEAVLNSYSAGKAGAGDYSNMVKYLCDKTGIPAIVACHFIGGARVSSAYVQIDGITYTSSVAGVQTYGLNDKYVFIDKNFDNLEIVPDPFIPVEQPDYKPLTNFREIGNLATGEFVTVYYADDTAYDYMNSSAVDKIWGQGHKFYKCANHDIVPMTEAEAISLGYVPQ